MFEIRPSLPAVRPSRIVGLDFETYYDADYTLRKLATSAYIRDAAFEAYGLSHRTYNLETRAFEGETDWVDQRGIPAFLKSVDWNSTAVLAHHTAFDGLILSHHYGVIPAYYYDTVSMARALLDHSIGASLDEVARFFGLGSKVTGVLDEVKGIRLADMPRELYIKLAAYGINDTDIMWKSFLKMLPDMPQDELDLIHLTINMFTNPVLEVDQELAREELEYEINRRETVLNNVQELVIDGGYYDLIHEAIQDEKPYKTETGKIKGAALAREKRDKIPVLEKVQSLLSSNKTFPMLLSALGESVAYKPGKKEDIPAIAKNDLEFHRLQASSLPHVAEICEARLAVKSTLGESRAQRLLDHSTPRLPIMLNYAKAHTLRWSGGDKLNPQNFPAARKGNPARLRRSILAPRGYVLVVADSSQIEDRMNCWMAGQDDILDLYRTGGDPYLYTAEELYSVPHGTYNKKEHKAERGQGKVARLGLGYGCGKDKYRLINQVGAFGPPQPDFTLAQATRDVNRYREMSTAIVGFWQFLGQQMLPLMIEGGEHAWIPPHGDKPILTFHAEGVDLPNGLMLHYPELTAQRNKYTGAYTDFTYRIGKRGGHTKIYGGLFDENIDQCLSRITVGEQMLVIAEEYRIVMMTHDEIIFLAPERKAEQALEFAIKVMSTPPTWAPTLPVAAEGGYAKEYSK